MSTAAAIPGISKRHVAAAVIGNALEFYDFTTYSLFSLSIGNTFFPNNDPFVRLMLSLATFGIGFTGRPIGALVLGRIADRVGRKAALLISFSLMGVGLVGLALVPSYAKIGIAAPILVVLCRLLQGFALGGEVGPTMAYLIEAAPARRRGLYGSWQSASQSIATLSGAAVGFILSANLTHRALDDWGWRVAFLIGAIVLPFGLIIRGTLPETLHHEEAPLEARPATATLRAHLRPLLLGVAMIMSFTTSTYVFGYMTTYAQNDLHMSSKVGFGVTIVSGTVGLIFTLLGGHLSDLFGRKLVMLAPRILFLVATLPAFYLIVRNHDVVTFYIAIGSISALSSMSAGAALINLTETIRKELRGLAVGGVYAVAVTVFGGVTQPILAALIHLTGDKLSPAYYMMAATAVGIIGMSMMKESAPIKTLSA